MIINSYFLTLLLSYTLLCTGCGAKTADIDHLSGSGRAANMDSVTNTKTDTTGTQSRPGINVGIVDFDKVKWTSKEGKDYPLREEMYEALMTNTEFRSLKPDEVLSLLGPPDRSDGNYLFYTISQKRLGALPINTKTLVIKFTDDNTIEWIKLHG